MRYGSVCSGIEAATAAWHPLGWEPAFFSEIEAFPRAVLQHHYPDVPLHGDFTTIQENDYGAIDLLVGGTPCQSFSVAGLRKGLDDERGNLALEYLRLAQRLRPKWMVWENVPGVLSSGGGRDFGAFLGGLVELGYGFAYRVLDAFHFGCAIPRPRVFVVAHSGACWQRAAAVLFEREALSVSSKGSRRWPRPHTLSTQNAGSRNARGNIIIEKDGWRGMTPIETERALGFADDYTKVPFTNSRKRPGGEAPLEPEIALRNNSRAVRGDEGITEQSVRNMRDAPDAKEPSDRPRPRLGGCQGAPLPSMQHSTPGDRGRRLDDAGDGVPVPRLASDGPRYKALGNSMAVPVMAWIGQRIQEVESLGPDRAEDRIIEIVVGIN